MSEPADVSVEPSLDGSAGPPADRIGRATEVPPASDADPSPDGVPSHSNGAGPVTATASDESRSLSPVVNVVGPVESSSESLRDVDQLDATNYPPRQYPAGLPRRTGFQAVVRRSVLNEIHRHGQSTLDVEVCGVVVGNVFRDESGPFLVIDGSIRGTNATSRNAQVTFTAETWTAIQAEMEANHPHRRIVGWYHTHPGFGIFLSDMDLFIHGNFFNLTWQVALVYDPKSGEEGLFVWKAGKTEREPMQVEEDVEKEIAAPPTEPVNPELVGELAWQLARFEKRLKTMTVVLGVVVLLALVWPWVLFTGLEGRRGVRPLPVAAPPQAPVVHADHRDESAVANPPASPESTPSDVTAAAAGPIPEGGVPSTRPTGPVTQPAEPGEAVVTPPATKAPPTTAPLIPQVIEILRPNGSDPSRGPKVFEAQPDNREPGSPK